jgi:hypothetical protein
MEDLEPVNLRIARDFGATVNAVFAFLRAHWKPFAKAVVYIMAPVLLLGAVGAGFYFRGVFSAFGMRNGVPTPDGIFGIYSQMLPTVAFVGTIVTIAVALLYAVVGGYVRLVVDGDGSAIQVDDVWREVRGTFFRIVGTDLVLLIIFVIPFALLIAITSLAVTVGGTGAVLLLPLLMIIVGVAVIYFAVVQTIVVPMRLEEDIGTLAAIGRAFRLMKGRWWFTFGIMLVMYIIVAIGSSVFEAPTYAIGFSSVLHGDDPSPVLMMVTGAIAFMGSYLLNSIVVLTTFVQYYNLVEHSEGVGMASRINEIGAPAEDSSVPGV